MGACHLSVVFFLFHLCWQLIREIKQSTKRGRAWSASCAAETQDERRDEADDIQPGHQAVQDNGSQRVDPGPKAKADPEQVVIAPTIAVALGCPLPIQQGQQLEQQEQTFQSADEDWGRRWQMEVEE